MAIDGDDDDQATEPGPDLGLSEAHTRGDPARARKVGATAADAEAAIGDLVDQLGAGDADEQLDLLLGEDSPFAGPVKHVAETMAAHRGRGRPKGSANKANALFRDTIMRMGFRHPGLNLAALANANPHDLAAELSEPYYNRKQKRWMEASLSPGDALALILKANEALMPYFESKRPTEVNVTERSLGVMLVGDLGAGGQRADDDDILSVTGTVRDPDETPENSDT